MARVTEGAAELELVPVDPREDAFQTYQLQLRKVDSEAPPSDLGIYRITEAGYPLQRWFSRAKWEGNPEQPDKQYTTSIELEGSFKRMLSNPESRLVVLVTFFQQQPSAMEKEPTSEKKPRSRR